jgi:hypothetical protein
LQSICRLTCCKKTWFVKRWAYSFFIFRWFDFNVEPKKPFRRNMFELKITFFYKTTSWILGWSQRKKLSVIFKQLCVWNPWNSKFLQWKFVDPNFTKNKVRNSRNLKDKAPKRQQNVSHIRFSHKKTMLSTSKGATQRNLQT